MDKYEKMKKIFQKSTSKLDEYWDTFKTKFNNFFNG